MRGVPYDPDRHHRRSIRLPGYDYSQAGAYFVTINTHNRECLFGTVASGEIHLSAFGEIALEAWLNTPVLRPQVALDELVIMPNHLHATLFIVPRRGVLQYAPTPPTSNTSKQRALFKSPSQTLGAIVRGFKGATTKRINLVRGTPDYPVWQPNYHERVLRDEHELNVRRNYIAENPSRWDEDEENPDRQG